MNTKIVTTVYHFSRHFGQKQTNQSSNSPLSLDISFCATQLVPTYRSLRKSSLTSTSCFVAGLAKRNHRSMNAYLHTLSSLQLRNWDMKSQSSEWPSYESSNRRRVSECFIASPNDRVPSISRLVPDTCRCPVQWPSL
jgi:hypothetical protein